MSRRSVDAVLCFIVAVHAGCNLADDGSRPVREFRPPPTLPSDNWKRHENLERVALGALPASERMVSTQFHDVVSLGKSVVEIIAIDEKYVTRAYVVDEDGDKQFSQQFWREERAAHELAFGKMTSELFSHVAASPPNERVLVDITIAADLPEPQLPFDGTDQVVPIAAYEAWVTNHSHMQQQRVRVAGNRMRGLLASLNAEIVFDGRGLPIFRVRVDPQALLLQAFHEPDVVSITVAQPEDGALLGYAGHASMLEDQLIGGTCGGACDGA